MLFSRIGEANERSMGARDLEIMNLGDLFVSLFWLLVSFFVCLESIQVGIGTVRSPGPGFFPFYLGITLGSFGIVLVITNIQEKRGEGKLANPWKGVEWRRVILVLSSLFIYVILLPILGYLIMTFILMTILFGIMGRPKLWIQLVCAIITVLTSYIIFYVWLSIQLPKGMVGF